MPALTILAALLASPQAGASRIEAYYLGHSLASDIPDMVMALAGSRFRFKEQNIPGAPLRWQWQEAERNTQFEPQFQGRYDRVLSASTQALVMVDSVPRGEEPSLQESVEYASRFLQFARQRNPRIRAFYYEPWHHLSSGTPQRYEHDKQSPSRELRWRPRLTDDRKRWNWVVTEVNRRNPGTVPMRLIPAGTGLGMLSDAVRAGKVPGLKSDRDFFDDDIHLNPIGKYFVACLHYRALFGESPVGKPFEIANRWGTSYWDTPTWDKKTWKKPGAATMRAVQEIAASVPMP